MCLDPGWKMVVGTALIESGWKYFDGRNQDRFPVQSWKGSQKVPFDQWLTAITNNPPAYGPGFHVFTDEKETKKNYYTRMRRVYYRRVTVTGTDRGMPTVVAQEIYVPSRDEDWPPIEKGKKDAV